MKTSFALLVAITAAAWAATVPEKQVESITSSAVEIPFTTRFKASDLSIDSVTGELGGDQVKFGVKYQSGRKRFLSLFDPPSGAIVKHMDASAVKQGSGVATLTVPREKLSRVTALTIRFSTNDASEADRNFIFLQTGTPSVRALLGTPGKTAVPPGNTKPAARGVVKDVTAFADIRWCDASAVADLGAEMIAGLTYNEATRWSDRAAETSRGILQRGMDPGLGVKDLHRAGITGAGVSVGIIDQNIFLDHPEFKDRIARYKDVGCNASRGSMHGPAVASLLVGKNIGTAPGARLFFAAAPSWTKDAKFQADALNWLLDQNETLSATEKIRVISVSAAPSGPTSPFTKNQPLWDLACERAAKAGVLVLDCTAHRGIIGACYYDPSAPHDPTRVLPGFPGSNFTTRGDRVLAPASRRTVAEEYVEGAFGYQYTGRGGLSWAIPYAAGVLALGWQVNPQLSTETMVALLRATASEHDGAKVIINPAALVDAVKRQVPGRSD